MVSHGRAQGRGRPRGSFYSRGSTKGISLAPQVEQVGDIRPTQVLQSSSTLVLEWLLIHLLTHLESSPLSEPSVSSSLSIVHPFMIESFYGISPDLSMDLPMVLIFAYGTLQTLSIVPPNMVVFKYSIARSGVQQSSMLSP